MAHVRVVVDNRIRVDLSGLDPEVGEDLRREFDHDNTKRESMRRAGIQGWWAEPKTITTWADEGQALSLPRGGMEQVRSWARRHGLAYAVRDERTDGDPALRHQIPRHRVELWPHQEHAVQVALRKQQCILRAPTGSGKTTIGFALAARTGLPTLVVVNSAKLLEQWLERAGRELGLRTRDVGVIRGSRLEVRPLTLAMQPTLAEHGVSPELASAFGAVVCDEVQLFAAKTFFAAVDPFRARYRVGISADQRRKDRKEFLVHDLFSGVAADVCRDELERAGKVLDVEVRVLPTRFAAPWYGVPEDDSTASGDEENVHLDFGRLLEEMAADADRNALAVWAAQLEAQDEGERVLVMAHHRDHCRQLSQQLVLSGVRTGFLIGGQDYSREFDRTAQGLASGALQAGVGTIRSVGQGIDMPWLAAIVVATPIAGNRQVFGQARGRACRAPAGKRYARMYYLWDRRVFGYRHLENLVRWNRTVVVREGDGWVEGRAYLKRARQRAEAGAA